jgi:hypothetical protein
LLYKLEQGEVEELILQQVAKNNAPLPDRIKNAPQLNWGLELYYSAFFDLSSCRPLGFSPGQIRWIDIHDYADKLFLNEDQREDLHVYIRAMDATYLSWCDKKSKEKKHAKSG